MDSGFHLPGAVPLVEAAGHGIISETVPLRRGMADRNRRNWKFLRRPTVSFAPSPFDSDAIVDEGEDRGNGRGKGKKRRNGDQKHDAFFGMLNGMPKLILEGGTETIPQGRVRSQLTTFHLPFLRLFFFRSFPSFLFLFLFVCFSVLSLSPYFFFSLFSPTFSKLFLFLLSFSFFLSFF